MRDNFKFAAERQPRPKMRGEMSGRPQMSRAGGGNWQLKRPVNGRCPIHRGLSTGAKTLEERLRALPDLDLEAIAGEIERIAE